MIQKKKYDFSQWDKYNDGNNIMPMTTPTPMQPYVPVSNTYTNPYVQQSPTTNYNINQDHNNKLYDTQDDYKPGEFRPSNYNVNPYDYRYSDQQFQPNATKDNGTQQLYQQKPGQQACQIF